MAVMEEELGLPRLDEVTLPTTPAASQPKLQLFMGLNLQFRLGRK